MKPDKHKKKDYFKGGRGGYDDSRTKQRNPMQFIQDEDKLDELPSKVPSVVSYGGKHYSNAFLRLLRANIGKRWDDIYSILSEKLGDSKDDIKWYVDQNAYKRADGAIVSIGYCGEREVRGFYVLNGILGEQKKSWRYKRDTSKVKATYVDGFVVFKHKNIYFKAPMDKAISAKDLWVNSSADYNRTDYYVIYTDRRKFKKYYWCGEKYAIQATHIRQLSSKEIMHWDLPNTEINQNLGLFFN